MKFIDMTGKKIGRLTVIKRVENLKGCVMWLCKCECGNEKILKGTELRTGKINSCGCLHKEILIKINKETKRLYNNLPYNKSQKRLNNIWRGIIKRCYNVQNPAYKNYGKRGIIVCDDWKNNFINFYNWAVNNGYADNLTIDRINNNGNYEPSNCRWVTQYVQNRNQRSNKIFTYNGKTLCLADWSKVLNIPYTTLIYRLKHWSIEKAFNKLS